MIATATNAGRRSEPVVTSNSSSLPEVAGDAALLVDLTSVADLAEATNALMQNEDLQRTLKTKGPRQAARFSWNKAARETLVVYKSVLGR